MDRLIVAATLKPGSRGRAAELVAEGSPFDPRGSGLTSHGLYLSEHEVVFAFEGPGAEFLVRAMINDPVRAEGFGAWAPLIQGFPRLVRENWHWSRAADEADEAVSSFLPARESASRARSEPAPRGRRDPASA